MGDFVVKKNETEELYLRHPQMHDVDPVNFDVLANAWEFNTLEDAEAKALEINAGSLGVPKP
jgi:hypothetical protein